MYNVTTMIMNFVDNSNNSFSDEDEVKIIIFWVILFIKQFLVLYILIILILINLLKNLYNYLKSVYLIGNIFI